MFNAVYKAAFHMGPYSWECYLRARVIFTANVLLIDVYPLQIANTNLVSVSTINVSHFDIVI